MEKIKVQVKFKNGLHSREAIQLVELSKHSQSDIYLLKDDEKINTKSLIRILTAQIKENEIINFEIEGVDEIEVKENLIKLFK